jgi:hypothetical protein
MAPKLIRSFLVIALLAAALLAMPATHAAADGAGPADAAFPALGTFTGWVNNGQADQLRGVYVPNILADSVVQQPANYAGFVSPRQDIITQFGMAASLGSTGLLAHNYLAGAKFSSLQYGQSVYLVYGDGRTTSYVVTQVYRYQALQPNSQYSDFVDLGSGATISGSDVFNSIYGRHGAVVFQTCIAANGVSSWGRLFVIAEPYVQSQALNLRNLQ